MSAYFSQKFRISSGYGKLNLNDPHIEHPPTQPIPYSASVGVKSKLTNGDSTNSKMTVQVKLFYHISLCCNNSVKELG